MKIFDKRKSAVGTTGQLGNGANESEGLEAIRQPFLISQFDSGQIVKSQ